MGNQQMQDMLSPHQTEIAKIKSMIEDIENTDKNILTTQPLTDRLFPVPDSVPELDSPGEPISTEAKLSELLQPIPESEKPSEIELFTTMFTHEYPTSVFKQIDNATEITLSKTDFAGVLSRQVGRLDQRMHELLNMKAGIQAQYEELVRELTPP